MTHLDTDPSEPVDDVEIPGVCGNGHAALQSIMFADGRYRVVCEWCDWEGAEGYRDGDEDPDPERTRELHEVALENRYADADIVIPPGGAA
jgi:hypothetical protein